MNCQNLCDVLQYGRGDNVDIRAIIDNFDFKGSLLDYKQFGSGHINKTYLARFDGGRQYVVQGINTFVFGDVDALMNNIFAVTAYLSERIAENGGDPERETLRFIPTKEGNKYLRTEDGECWRAYRFVENSIAYDKALSAELMEKSGEAFGRFQKLLCDFPADTLSETIPHFHDTPWRFHHEFEPAVHSDIKGRAALCKKEIEYISSRENMLYSITDSINDGTVPLRVTHNDTKLNNVLFDEKTGDILAVIDLDTVMPGSALYDFGDSIRFGAAAAGEDDGENAISLEMFEAYARGFLSQAGETLTVREYELLPYSAWLITFECGMRFLTDYLVGDVYFGTDFPEHNLVRAKNQLSLAKDIETNLDEMKIIITEIKTAEV
jgi:N-acetylhexosamine 1-kinase